MQTASWQLQLIVNIICALGGMVFGYVLKREIRLATLEVQFKNIDEKLDRIIGDINGVALFVGTPRAKAEQSKAKEVVNDKSI